MADTTHPYPVTPDFQCAFGAIIHAFARNEYLIEDAIAAMLGANPGRLHIVASGLGYSAKRDALLTLLTVAAKLPRGWSKEIREFLKALHARNSLRNWIAHSMWIRGTRPNSIKPLRIQVRGGAGKIHGLKDDEPDLTTHELADIAAELSALHDKFRDYLESVGAMGPPIAKNTATSISSTES